MSNKRIIYKKKNGVVSIIIPTQDALKSMTVEEIAKKMYLQIINIKL